MDENSSGSPLDQAVSLAAWLIRTGKQRPGRAIHIAARKHGVDRHLVAERVGRRGGRRAAAVGRSGERRQHPSDSPTTRACLADAPLPVPEVVRFLVLAVEATEAVVQLGARPVAGMFAGTDLFFQLPIGWLPPVTVGDRITCGTTYTRASDGSVLLNLVQFLWNDPAVAT